MSRFAIVGAGAWGTALGALYARAGHETTLLARDPATATVAKGSVTRDIVAAPEGDGANAVAVIPG